MDIFSPEGRDYVVVEIDGHPTLYKDKTEALHDVIDHKIHVINRWRDSLEQRITEEVSSSPNHSALSAKLSESSKRLSDLTALKNLINMIES